MGQILHGSARTTEAVRHLQTFLMAYHFARRLKTLKGLTPYEFVCKTWTNEPERFTINPTQHTVGLNSQRDSIFDGRHGSLLRVGNTSLSAAFVPTIRSIHGD